MSCTWCRAIARHLEAIVIALPGPRAVAVHLRPVLQPSGPQDAYGWVCFITSDGTGAERRLENLRCSYGGPGTRLRPVPAAEEAWFIVTRWQKKRKKAVGRGGVFVT